MRIIISFEVAPFLRWFKDYDRDKFLRDAIAGLTIAAVLVPQSMAYALLAGMPPIYGLYASFLPTILAAMFGSSRFLATGPVAMTALLSASVLYGFAEPGSEKWINLMGVLALMVGFIRLTIGLLKLGFVVELISTSVITGFVSAGALVIALSQTGHLLGFKITQSTLIYQVVVDIFSKIEKVNPYTVGIGILAYAIIWLSKKIHPLVPGALLSVIITSLLNYFYDLERFGVAIVGQVPQGIPVPSLPSVDYSTIASLWGGAMVVAAFGLIEAVAIAKRLAVQSGDKWDANQELIGQGIANIVAGIFKGFPVGGSFSRSALNFQLNAKTPLASFITGSVVGITLIILAPAFYYLPKATLSSIVLSAVISLIKPYEIVKLYKVNKVDGLVAGTTFVSVFFMELWVALTLGTLIALGSFVYKTMYPRLVVLTRNPQSNTFVNAERERLPECPQILYIRPNMPIYFANAEYVYEYVLEKVRERKERGGLKFLLFDMEAVQYMDATGAYTLIRLFDELRRQKVEPAMANIACDVYPILERIGFERHIDTDLIFDSKGHSIVELFKRLDHEYCAKKCPYAVFRECYSVKPTEFKPVVAL
ncbi:sulfate transporter [Hydrogenobacter thermophilus TK-6]|uniref:Sulfate transporter n=1 Tax=Hydrogenobacter thermophilus (strain DSM 6534 / IAM 12695 / TK-6) TaxID=608538 RepID=D3DJF8_HYDTT|nr:SulP family inorganic anion transporter [Hydrogenobacter thermophilus]ADO45882.1 sulfate transporter [Hydrogenobacter thermophilus TK-6]BAI69960.1 sulfate transporter [Hydrogenobacter thermophilus TK-6]